MTDEIKNEGIEDKTNGKAPDKKAAITIFVKKDGGLEVTGMINDKTLAYGLLEMAKDMVRDYHKKLQAELESKLVKPPNNFLNNLRKGGK